MHALPDDMPGDSVPHPAYETASRSLCTLVDTGNPYACLLSRVLSQNGQTFVKTAEIALKKPGTQEVVESLLNAIAAYFSEIRPDEFPADDIEAICTKAEAGCIKSEGQLGKVMAEVPELKDKVQAMIMLSCLSVKLINPIFSSTDAIGTMMRKKIKPITEPVMEQLQVLMKG